ncbi:MAG: Gfo/Idh/MocA family oxidoreductase [Provencibacterium sp.]|nr:Gfo/Idh/MocA family oxidoreductase [Provencibacterium sp.]
MWKVGIIGTENSHAMAFARILNLPDPQTGKPPYEDIRVVGVYGPDMDTAQDVKDQAQVNFIADSPEDFFGRVDTMMVTCRKGSLHEQYARPFMEAGMPLFIDKPFTSDWEQAARFARDARERGVLLAGGSGCKYAWDVLLLQHKRQELCAAGKLLSAAVNFSADRDSIYDGFYFYAPHLTEIALTVFGYDVRSVHAFESRGGVVAVLRYDGFDATLHYTRGSSASTCVLFGKEGNVCREIDISLIYRHEVDRFAEMLHTGKMPVDYPELIGHVALIHAVLESLQSGKEAVVERLERV